MLDTFYINMMSSSTVTETDARSHGVKNGLISTDLPKILFSLAVCNQASGK